MIELLAKVGWSKAEFARRVGVSYKTVLNWEKKGAPRLAILYLELIAHMMGVRDGD